MIRIGVFLERQHLSGDYIFNIGAELLIALHLGAGGGESVAVFLGCDPAEIDEIICPFK